MASPNMPAGGSPGKHLSADDLAGRRHAELIESLWRLNVGLEALYQLGERQLKAFASAEQKLETGLAFFIEAWQGTRKKPANDDARRKAAVAPRQSAARMRKHGLRRAASLHNHHRARAAVARLAPRPADQASRPLLRRVCQAEGIHPVLCYAVTLDEN